MKRSKKTVKRRVHKVAPEGSRVFVAHNPDQGALVKIPVGGVVLKARVDNTPAIRQLSDDEYCGRKH